MTDNEYAAFKFHRAARQSQIAAKKKNELPVCTDHKPCCIDRGLKTPYQLCYNAQDGFMPGPQCSCHKGKP